MQSITAGAHAHSYLRVLRRWWWLPILLGAVSAGVTYAGTKALIKPEYGGSVQVGIQQSTSGPITQGFIDADTASVLMTGSVVRGLTQDVIDCNASRALPSACLKASEGLLGRKYRKPSRVDFGVGIQPADVTTAALDPRALGASSCSPDSTDKFVTCSTTSRNYLVPASVMNILSAVFIAWDKQRAQAFYQPQLTPVENHIASLTRQLNSVKNEIKRTDPSSPQYSSLENQRTGLAANINVDILSKQSIQNSIANNEGHLSVTNQPVAVDIPVSPHPARNAILGFIVGIGIAAALIVLLEYLDDTFRSTDEVFETTGLPLIGAVRKYEGTADEMGMVAAKMPRTAIAEAYRVARANIQFTEIGANLKVLVVTSARDGEGKTTTANNLATTFALAGQRVLLVDADLRRPGLTKMLGMRDSHGLSSVLLDPDADVIRPTEVVGLSVVPSGAIPPNPAELLGSPLMRAWIEKVADRFDLIVLDTPPVLSVADTRILATLADAVILILDPAITTRRMVRQARLAVENVGGRLLGIMLNRDVMRGEGYYYNYYYYEKSAYGKADREREQRRAGR
jgi:capsular exopolysaccharide synthesis family protein